MGGPFRSAHPESSTPCSSQTCTGDYCTQTILGHVILEQEMQPHHSAALVTTHRSEDSSIFLQQIALSLQPPIPRRGLLQQLNLQRLSTDQWHFAESIAFGLFDPEPVEPGAHLDVYWPRFRSGLPGETPPHVFLANNHDQVFLMQRCRRQHRRQPLQQHGTYSGETCTDGLGLSAWRDEQTFQFNPLAPEFGMPRPAIASQAEFVQDLFALWRTEAFTWEAEVSSCAVAVWFVNHQWARPHGLFSRQVQIYENYQTWEETIKNAWRDYIDPATEVEIFLVDPTPPSVTNEVVAHGPVDGLAVLHYPGKTSKSTDLWRALLAEFHLSLPQTSLLHWGDQGTWTSLDGQSEHCLDYVAIPQQALANCTHSQLLDSLELGPI